MIANKSELEAINRRIVELGKTLNKMVVATGDVHFLDPQDEIYRRMGQDRDMQMQMNRHRCTLRPRMK